MRPEYYAKNRDKWREYTRRKKEKYPLYTVWHGMLVRTGVRPGAKPHEIKDYIARGITVCDEWKDYATFEAWAIANGWRSELRIDRIDNDKGYSPDNCRFVTPSRNQRNRRNTAMVVWNGLRQPLIDVYEAVGCQLDYRLVLDRVAYRGWSLERAMTTPPIHHAA